MDTLKNPQDHGDTTIIMEAFRQKVFAPEKEDRGGMLIAAVAILVIVVLAILFH